MNLKVGVMIVCLSATAAVAQAESMRLSRSVIITDLTEHASALNDHQKSALVAPLEKWRVKAQTAAAKREGNAEEDYQLIQEGARHTNPVLFNEFVTRLSDERIAVIYEKAVAADPPEVAAKLRIADEVLLRPDLVEYHDSAAFMWGAMRAVSAFTPEEALVGFREAETRSATDAGARRLEAAAGALTDPQSNEEYRLTVELIDLFSKHEARLASLFAVSPVLNQYSERGSSHFALSKRSSEPTALLTAARCAFEMSRGRMLEDLLDASLKEGADPETTAEIRYWLGMDHFGANRHDHAIQLFEKNVESSLDSTWVYWSHYMMAKAYQGKREYLNAAVWLVECIAVSKAHPEIVTTAEELYKMLIHDHVSEAEALAAHSTHTTKKETAAVAGELSEGVR